MLPKGKSRGLRIIVDDAGKASRVAPPAEGYAVLYLDILGTGELKDIDMRYAVYMGRSVAFTGGWQIVRAAEAMKSRYGAVEIEANGALSSQAAMWAGLMSSQFREIDATGCLQDWQEVFRRDVSPFAVQPRAHLLGTLANLRAKVKNATWKQ